MKKIIILLFFLFLTIPALIWAGNINSQDSITYSNTPTLIPVLCYHRVIPKVKSIFDLSPDMLEKQFKFLKEEGYQPITALQLINFQKGDRLIPDKPVVLTFDDGNLSHYRYVFPLLKKYGYRATFFVYPSAVVNHESKKYLTWTELTEMSRAGMDIESHSMNHPYLTNIDTDLTNTGYLKWLDFELKNAKDILEKKLNIQVRLLAYPFGLFNQVVETKAVEAGYEGAFTVNWGSNSLTGNPLRIKRRIITNKYGLPELKRILNTRVLPLEIISPIDASVITEAPLIRFKLNEPNIKSLKIEVGKEKSILIPSRDGVYTYQPQKLRLGYNMIIVSGTDEQQNYYVGSWNFYIQKPVHQKDLKNPS